MVDFPRLDTPYASRGPNRGCPMAEWLPNGSVRLERPTLACNAMASPIVVNVGKSDATLLDYVGGLTPANDQVGTSAKALWQALAWWCTCVSWPACGIS